MNQSRGKINSIFLIIGITAIILLGAPSQAEAYTCTLLSPGFVNGYPVPSPANVVTPFTFTVSCTWAVGDPASVTVNYSVGVNNGGVTSGGWNIANSGANTILYDTYKDAGCTTKWGFGGGGAARTREIHGTFTISNGSPYTSTTTVYGCVQGGQNPAAGTYTDLLTMTLTNTGTGTAITTGSFTITIITPATCTATAPTAVTFTYTSFQALISNSAGGSFTINCTNLIPYTLTLDSASGTILGLTYNLQLPGGVLGATSVNRTGSGANQNLVISGQIAPGQSGTCATATCGPTSQVRILTITY